MSRIVVALGGNALGSNYLEQQKLLREASKELIKLFKDNEVIIVHGNGPQVGMITKALAGAGDIMPLDCCTAMSQGYIGFHIQRKIKQILLENNIDRDVVTVVTEVLVDKSDPSFKNPTKPIGRFYNKKEAMRLAAQSKDTYVEDAGRGYRKVVASPKPIDIININPIETLVKNGTIVIACGGGGIPVINNYNETKVEAVIDKDLASALIAQKLNADKFVILTGVDQVMINFKKENQTPIDSMSVKEAQDYIKNDEFKKGSMLPKIEAAIDFVQRTGKDAIITGLLNIQGILNNKNITIIHK